MKRKVISAILLILLVVVFADLFTLNIRVKSYLQKSLNYPDTCQVYVKYSDDEYHVYESPNVDGFRVVKFNELPKSMYYKLKVLDFMVEQSTNVILI